MSIAEDQPLVKVTPKKWNCVASWAWNVQNDVCAICREQLADPCIECKAGNNDGVSGCVVAFGACNHAFHHHCIGRWHKTRTTCPLDNREWETASLQSA